MITMQVKKNKLVYEEMFPFRKGGDMVQPDSECCKVCKGGCCNGPIPLYPRDFERGKEVVSVIKLLKMELVSLYIIETIMGEHHMHVYTSNNDSTHSCIFKCVWGCIIPADMRPLICKFYGPLEKETAKHDWKYCTDIQNYSSYGDMDWLSYKEEFLKMGVLECPNVTMNGATK